MSFLQSVLCKYKQMMITVQHKMSVFKVSACSVSVLLWLKNIIFRVHLLQTLLISLLYDYKYYYYYYFKQDCDIC